MGKKHAAAVARLDTETHYSPREALGMVKELAFAGFDESVEVAVLLGIDPKQADQAVRGTVSLPHGTGKEVRVAVFADGEAAGAAEAAGADVVGGKELADEIAGGRPLDFDVAVAAPDMMSEVGKLGRILGPRGLMPNPKAGTVTPDVAQAVAELKAGRVEYRNDRHGNVHAVIGKVSFEQRQLEENLATIVAELLRARPAPVKGRFVRKVTLSSSMGPGIKVDVGALDELAAQAR